MANERECWMLPKWKHNAPRKIKTKDASRNRLKSWSDTPSCQKRTLSLKFVIVCFAELRMAASCACYFRAPCQRSGIPESLVGTFLGSTTMQIIKITVCRGIAAAVAVKLVRIAFAVDTWRARPPHQVVFCPLLLLLLLLRCFSFFLSFSSSWFWMLLLFLLLIIIHVITTRTRISFVACVTRCAARVYDNAVGTANSMWQVYNIHCICM